MSAYRQHQRIIVRSAQAVSSHGEHGWRGMLFSGRGGIGSRGGKRGMKNAQAQHRHGHNMGVRHQT